MTIALNPNAALFRQMDALGDLLKAWRGNEPRDHVTAPAASVEEAVGAEAGHRAYRFTVHALEASNRPSDFVARLHVEAAHARRDGFPESHHPLLAEAYADVLQGFAEAVLAIK